MSSKKYLILSLICLFLLIAPIQAHEWYPATCCSDQDCHPILCNSITEQGKNLVYKGFSFYGDMIKPSQDSQCHVCIFNEARNPSYSPVPRCIFIQQPTS